MNLNDLKGRFPDLEFKSAEIVAPYTFMKVGGAVSLFVEVVNQGDLFSLVSHCFLNDIPFLIFGGASNSIFPDEGVDKLVIRNLTNSISYEKKSDNSELVTVDSGVITALLANKTMDRGLTGLEYFVGVPGTIGGAVVNNSHFSSQELIGKLIQEVEVCTPAGKIEVWKNEELKFDYDYSVFHEKSAVILSASFVLEKADPTIIQTNVRSAALKRTSTQPIGVPSTGCMYRNPVISTQQFATISSICEVPQGAYQIRGDSNYQVAAGFLIDQAGMKGTKVGGAEVSEKHATYIINTGLATAHDIESLCQIIEKAVLEKFAVKLEREVFFLK